MSNIAELALSMIKGVGIVSIRKLISYYGSAEKVLLADKRSLKNVPEIGEHIIKLILNSGADVFKLAEQELRFCDDNDIEPLFYLDKKFPKRLNHCPDTPSLIFSKGNDVYNNQKLISIVGTRNATEYGREFCDRIIREIAQNGHNAVIVSGLAYGVDIAAHKAALKYGLPTVAVLGHDLSQVYPSEHKKYLSDICRHGGIISEFRTFDVFDRKNFLRRNRIIAGMTDLTIVVESSCKGGAIYTAGLANDYNRDVFAVPGRVGDLRSQGCNKLIKASKACLIEGVSDIEYIMGWDKSGKSESVIQKKLFIELTGEEQKILEVINDEKRVALDVLMVKLSMPVSKLNSTLLKLEFDGLVKSLPGKMYVKK